MNSDLWTVDTLKITMTNDGLLLPVKIVPGASRSRLAGIWGEALKIAIAAPPEKGKANKALIKLLAGVLHLSERDIRVVQGQSSPHKILLIRGITSDELRKKTGTEIHQ